MKYDDRTRYSVLFATIAFQGWLLAQAPTPSLTIPRVNRPPKLADFLTNTPREAELEVSDFRQMDPGDGAPVSQPTKAYLSYDQKNLYVGFIAKDDPKRIRARIAKRKQILNDDRVTINIDTFHDHRHAYWFDVNPYAIQFDGITTDGYGDDFSWEGLWYTEAKITADGYVVLITIPFRTLRFSDAPKQEWGVMLGRFIQRNSEFSMWPYITRRKLPAFVAQFGHMNGLENISPGRNLQFIPYGLAAGSRYLEQPAGGVPRMATDISQRLGLDAKVVIKDAFTLDMTLNPDFSQVESDSPQVTVNQRFEVYFPEQRPFFMENASYFTAPQTLFFSRRIIDPEFGVRLTGRVGRWAIGVLAADDRAPGRLVPESSDQYGKRATNGVISIQRDFFKDSHARLFVTDREWAGGYNRVAAADVRLHLKYDHFLSAMAITSQSRSSAGQMSSGNSYYALLNRYRRDWRYYAMYTDRSPEFRAELGYIPRTDIREVQVGLGYRWWLEGKKLVNFGPSVIALGNWNRKGQTQDWDGAVTWDMEFTRQTSLRIRRTEAFELYNRTGFRRGYNLFSLRSEWFKKVTASADYSHGTSINYYPGAGYQPFGAYGKRATAGLTLRPTTRLRLDETYIYSHLRTLSGWQGQPARTIYANHIARSKANYQFTREWSLRAIVDYNGVIPNSGLASVARSKRFGYDLLATWLLHPGTALHVGYTDYYENFLLDPSRPPYLYRTAYPDLNTGRQIFVKLSYLLRF